MMYWIKTVVLWKHWRPLALGVATGLLLLHAVPTLRGQRPDCKTLGTEVMVWERCNPRNGCMASLTEETALVKKVVRCQEEVGARKDSGSNSR